jgi:hypothetical protein
MTLGLDIGAPLREIIVTPHTLPIPGPIAPAPALPVQEPVPA